MKRKIAQFTAILMICYATTALAEFDSGLMALNKKEDKIGF